MGHLTGTMGFDNIFHMASNSAASDLWTGPKRAYAKEASPRLSAVQLTAAKLYGRGLGRAQIAAALVDVIVPLNPQRWLPLKERKKRARRRLKSWEASIIFRDMVWEHAVVKMDMRAGQILDGVFGSAVRGRVDAAKLALEIAGRYSPKDQQQPTNVAIVFGSAVPRPQMAQPQEVIEVDPKELEP